MGFGSRATLLFLGLLIASLIYAISYTPAKEGEISKDISPILSLKSLNYYKIDIDSLSIIASIDELYRFYDYDLILGAKIDRFLEEKESIKASLMKIEDSRIYFDSGVIYKRDGGILASLDSGVYDMRSMLLKSDGDFKIETNGFSAIGQSLIYDRESEEIVAQNIGAVIEIEDLR